MPTSLLYRLLLVSPTWWSTSAPDFKEMHEQTEQAKLPDIAQLAPVFGLDRRTCVDRFDRDPRVRPWIDARTRPEADGGVERLRARVKEIERPDVDRASSQVNACWC